MFCKITKAILENDIKDFSLHAVTGEPGTVGLSFPQRDIPGTRDTPVQDLSTERAVKCKDLTRPAGEG